MTRYVARVKGWNPMAREAALRRAGQIDKMKELILYVAEQLQGDENFGMVKLNKILFDADFTAYGRTGEPITGLEYQAQPNGPTLRRLLPIIEELETEGKIGRKRNRLIDYHVERVIALQDPDLGWFSEDELALVDEIIAWARPLTAQEISEASHKYVGWQVARKGEAIPYDTIFLDDRPLTERELEIGRQLARGETPSDAGGRADVEASL